MLQQEILKNINGLDLIFHQKKVLYIPSKKVLVLGDLHIGKATHFRKNGLPVVNNHQNDLDILSCLIDHYKAKKVLYLGDLFHSSYNDEHDDFRVFLSEHSDCEHVLIEGNHDTYASSVEGLKSVTSYEDEDVLLMHEIWRPTTAGKLHMSGHVHPAITLRGKGYQKLKLPAFILKQNHIIFPAYGSYCGTHQVRLKKNEQALVTTDEGITALTA